MPKQTDAEQERYEARAKAERDRSSSLLAAEQRGEQRTIIRHIQFCQDLLRRPLDATDSLLALPLADLLALAKQLEAEVFEQRGMRRQA